MLSQTFYLTEFTSDVTFSKGFLEVKSKDKSRKNNPFLFMIYITMYLKDHKKLALSFAQGIFWNNIVVPKFFILVSIPSTKFYL